MAADIPEHQLAFPQPKRIHLSVPRPIPLEKIELASDTPDESLLVIDEAIALLAAENPDCALAVKLRFYTDLPLDRRFICCTKRDNHRFSRLQCLLLAHDVPM